MGHGNERVQKCRFVMGHKTSKEVLPLICSRLEIGARVETANSVEISSSGGWGGCCARNKEYWYEPFDGGRSAVLLFGVVNGVQGDGAARLERLAAQRFHVATPLFLFEPV